jgi:hypothetical protein
MSIWVATYFDTTQTLLLTLAVLQKNCLPIFVLAENDVWVPHVILTRVLLTGAAMAEAEEPAPLPGSVVESHTRIGICRREARCAWTRRRGSSASPGKVVEGAPPGHSNSDEYKSDLPRGSR